MGVSDLYANVDRPLLADAYRKQSAYAARNLRAGDRQHATHNGLSNLPRAAIPARLCV